MRYNEQCTDEFLIKMYKSSRERTEVTPHSLAVRLLLIRLYRLLTSMESTYTLFGYHFYCSRELVLPTLPYEGESIRANWPGPFKPLRGSELASPGFTGEEERKRIKPSLLRPPILKKRFFFFNFYCVIVFFLRYPLKMESNSKINCIDVVRYILFCN